MQSWSLAKRSHDVRTFLKAHTSTESKHNYWVYAASSADATVVASNVIVERNHMEV